MNLKFFVFIYLCINCASATKLIDLGHALTHETPVFPIPDLIGKTFNLTVIHEGPLFEGGFWAKYGSFSVLEHIGTHFDAPYHLNPNGLRLEQIPVERLVTAAIVIDVSAKVNNNDNYEASVEDVDNWIATNGPIPNCSVVLIHTGWSKRYSNATAYIGSLNDTTKTNFPGMSPDAVKYIQSFKEKGINVFGFGIDGPVLDNGRSTEFLCHQFVLNADQYIIENLNNLDLLPAKGITLMVMPLKIKDGTGAPARVIAQIPSY